MSISLNFELNDRDLEHFQKAMVAAKESAKDRTAEDIISCSGTLLADAQKVHIPDFIKERLLRLDDMIAMVRDEGWHLPEEDRQRVLSALVYFCDPKDIIPDNVPVLGYFDDAIAIELCVKELRHELDAYDEFCDFRQNEAEARGLNPAAVGRAEWLAGRRDEIQDRMHRQRARDFGTGYGNSSGYAREGYSNPWRPSLLRVR